MWNTETEKAAILDKIMNPSKDVKCPTCNTSLIERQLGKTSNEILCPSCGIGSVGRGI